MLSPFDLFFILFEGLFFKKKIQYMVSVVFPKPNGHPQLVVTHKSAYIVDAYIQDKVILSIKAPKPGAVCSASPTTTKTRYWTLVLDLNVVYCYYWDNHVKATWRVELTPKDSDKNIILTLKSGFKRVGFSLEKVMVFLFTAPLAISCFMVFTFLMREMRDDNNFHYTDIKHSLNDVRHWTYELFIKDKKEDFIVTPGEGFKLPGANLELKTLVEEKEKETFELGSELKHDQFIQLGLQKLRLFDCSLFIDHSPTHSSILNINDYKDCTLSMQRDGNMVIYHPEKGALWSSKEYLKDKLCLKGMTLTKEGELVCQD